VLALVLVGLADVALAFELQARTRGRLWRTGPGAARAQRPVTLGAMRYAALGWCGLVTGVFLVVPAGVLLYWLARGIENERGLDLPLREAVHSLGASGLAAAAAIALALPVAMLASRYPTRLARGLERLAYAGNALPGLVIALSLVFFAARYASPVYQTLSLLVFAYVVRFFPQALSGLDTALARVSPHLEEASRGLGRGPWATTWRVTLPLVRRGMLAGVALVFLSAMKELPATILLRPIGFDTLATEIWGATQVGAYSQAAIPALLLVVLSAPVLWLLQDDRRELAEGAG
jgi:iron(III) transport system permease protein